MPCIVEQRTGADLNAGVHITEAVRRGDIEAVRAFLKANGNVNVSSRRTGRTLLHIACRQGHSQTASLLLSKGANSAATTLRRLTPLHLSSHEGHLSVARLLLEASAPVDDPDQAGATPLHLASQKGHVGIVRLLLQCGANKECMDERGWAPLHFAVWDGHIAVARTLLHAGANVRVADLKDNLTPLHLACALAYTEVAKTLLEFGANASAMDSNGAFPDEVVGEGCSPSIDDASVRELTEIVVGHRTRGHGSDAPFSLQSVISSLRAKVSELEDQLIRASKARLDLEAYTEDGNHHTFAAALKPECPLCQAEVKQAVLDPCRHLATCWNCAQTLRSCPFCGCVVQGYQQLQSREALEKLKALEYEGAGLKAQLESFRRRVRSLIDTDGGVLLDVNQAETDTLIEKAERHGQEQRFDGIIPPLRSELPAGGTYADSDSGSPGAAHGSVSRSNIEPRQRVPLRHGAGKYEESDCPLGPRARTHTEGGVAESTSRRSSMSTGIANNIPGGPRVAGDSDFGTSDSSRSRRKAACPCVHPSDGHSKTSTGTNNGAALADLKNGGCAMSAVLNDRTMQSGTSHSFTMRYSDESDGGYSTFGRHFSEIEPAITNNLGAHGDADHGITTKLAVDDESTAAGSACSASATAVEAGLARSDTGSTAGRCRDSSPPPPTIDKALTGEMDDWDRCKPAPEGRVRPREMTSPDVFVHVIIGNERQKLRSGRTEPVDADARGLPSNEAIYEEYSTSTDDYVDGETGTDDSNSRAQSSSTIDNVLSAVSSFVVPNSRSSVESSTDSDDENMLAIFPRLTGGVAAAWHGRGDCEVKADRSGALERNYGKHARPEQQRRPLRGGGAPTPKPVAVPSRKPPASRTDAS